MDLPIPATWAEAAPHLLPVVRRATEPAHAWLAEQQDPANRLIRRSFAPHLRELVCLDLPDLRMFVNQSHLDRWNVEEAQAFDAARDNLAGAATTGLQRQEEWGLWQLASGDGYESSRLLLPRWLSAFGPEAVAAIPSQRILLVGDGRDPDAVLVLQELAERAFRQGGGPLSPVLYTAGPKARPVPWVPRDADHPAWSGLRFAERLLAAWEYGSQADTLQGHTDHPLAPIALHRNGADCHTISEVSALPALLPQVDEVAIQGHRQPFEALEAQGRLSATELEPPRWLLS